MKICLVVQDLLHVGGDGRIDGETDTMKLIVAFLNFAKGA